ncbi:MAG: hypothetical protein Q8P83_02270 [bacterium]|nr:hypothetical protein [bacterium]
MPSNTTFSQKKNIIKTHSLVISDYFIDQLSVINIQTAKLFGSES